jgi:hypothetical protein
MSTSRRAPEATAEPAEQARPGVLAGPSSARLPFVPPPALRSAAGVHAALSVWAGTCFDLALHGLAVDLSEAAESVGHREDEPGSKLRHAAYLLHVDRFADALAALPPPGGGLPRAPSEVTICRSAASDRRGRTRRRPRAGLADHHVVSTDALRRGRPLRRLPRPGRGHAR